MPLWHRGGRPFTFITIHYIYITAWILIAACALYYIPGSLHYVDALLLASGAATQSGQNPVDLNLLSTGQQVTLWAVAMVTNVISVNSLLVLVRLSSFRKRFRSVVGEARAFRRSGAPRGGYGSFASDNNNVRPGRRSFEMQQSVSSGCDDGQSSTPQPINQIAASSAGPHITFDVAAHQQYLHQKAISSLPPLMWEASISSYSDWDETQKDELGGTEYRALKTLFFILLGYFVAFHLLGILSLLGVILNNPLYSRVVDNIGVSQGWWAIFTAGSAFNDVGFTLTPNSMASFNKVPLLLLVMTFLIVIGNTGFPCMLRFMIWVFSKTAREEGQRREELEFLLRHPRRCFTLLFPGADTWRLLGVLLVLNAVDLVIFLLLDQPPRIPGITWLINGLFQVASTRTAGFTVTSLADLHPAVQISFVVMMYISAFPTTIAMRKTNVYEEKSLGIYSDTDNDDAESNSNSNDNTQTTRNDLGYHIQKQLSFDLWYIVLGAFLIALVEGDRLQSGQQQQQPQQANEPSFSLFPILFEVVSAYGTVGLSLGYAWTESSLSSQFRNISKLVILAMQVRGRHRGLPYALDHAVMLPYELRRGDDFDDYDYDYEESDDDDENGNGYGWKGWLRRRRSDLSSLLSVHSNQSSGIDEESHHSNGNERERLL